MLNKLKKTFFLTFSSIIFLLNSEYLAQPNEPLYNVSFELGSGLTRYVTSITRLGVNKYSFNATARIMWQPEHLLSVGFETGYMPLYSIQVDNYQSAFGTAEVDLSLSAIPIMMTFGMKVYDNIKVYGGVGGAVLNSSADFFDNKVISSSWTNAYELGVSYNYKLNEQINFGGEFKWYNFSKIEDSALLLQILFTYNLLTY